ncbi:DUF2339 domain-containing protein, partial [Methylobacterium sp. WL9]
ERFGTRWTVWVGGVALIFGAALLVRYSVEAGYFGPGGRYRRGRGRRRPLEACEPVFQDGNPPTLRNRQRERNRPAGEHGQRRDAETKEENQLVHSTGVRSTKSPGCAGRVVQSVRPATSGEKPRSRSDRGWIEDGSRRTKNPAGRCPQGSCRLPVPGWPVPASADLHR